MQHRWTGESVRQVGGRMWTCTAEECVWSSFMLWSAGYTLFNKGATVTGHTHTLVLWNRLDLTSHNALQHELDRIVGWREWEKESGSWPGRVMGWIVMTTQPAFQSGLWSVCVQCVLTCCVRVLTVGDIFGPELQLWADTLDVSVEQTENEIVNFQVFYQIKYKNL